MVVVVSTLPVGRPVASSTTFCTLTLLCCVSKPRKFVSPLEGALKFHW